MDEAESVAAFHVGHPVLQLPIYHVNAMAMSRLLPSGGRVLDLGSGSAQLVAHLAAARPDVQITGIDLAERMLETGRSMLRERALDERVELRRADMTDLGEPLDEVDLVSTVWALHHLPTRDHLVACLREMARLRERHGCALWIFDFARLRRDDTFPAIFRLAPDAPPQLEADGIASERAAWSVTELREALHEAELDGLSGGSERMVGHFQCWSAPARDGRPDGHEEHWRAEPLSPATRTIVNRLVRTLPLP